MDITGIPGTSINAVCTAPDIGDEVTAEGVQAYLQSVDNDLATIKGGTYTTSAVVTFSDEIIIPNGADIVVESGGAVEVQSGGNIAAAVGSVVTFGGGQATGPISPLTALTGATVVPVTADVSLTSFTCTISAATNATPIVCTTSAAHGLFDGQTVDIAGGLINTAVNGAGLVAHVLSPTTFSILGSSGNGVYTPNSATMTARPQVGYGTPIAELVRILSRPTPSGYVNGSLSVSYAWQIVADNGGNVCGALTLTIGANSSLGVASSPQAPSIMWEIGAEDAPQGSYIIGAGAWYQPFGTGSSHVGAPGILPAITLCSMPLNTGLGAAPSVVTLAASTATYGSAGTYEAFTYLAAVPGSGVQVDRARNRYFVVLRTEADTNALPGTMVYGAVVYGSVTMPAQL